MKKAWDRPRVEQRNRRYARELSKVGVQLRRGNADDRPAVESLVREHIAGRSEWELDENLAVGVAVDKHESVIAASVVGVKVYGGGEVAVTIQYLVVAPAWRGRGVGVVTLGVLPQLLGKTAAFYMGSCAAQDGSFYQKAGYNVLDPGQPLLFPLGNGALLVNPDKHYTCWFFDAP